MTAGADEDVDQSSALIQAAVRSVEEFAEGAFFKLTDDQRLHLARELEVLARKVAHAQVVVAGEIDLAGTAKKHSVPSTGALLAQTLNISRFDANRRVSVARKVRDSLSATGDLIGPALPVLSEALADGVISLDHAAIILATERDIPNKVDQPTRESVERFLVDEGRTNEPMTLSKIATHLLAKLDPDGKLEDRNPADRIELRIADRNPATGLTAFNGRLDDEGMAVLRSATDALAAPRPETSGVKDVRPPANRLAQALVDALRHSLDAGTLPGRNGQRPHVTVTMTLDDLLGRSGGCTLDNGRRFNPTTTRRLLCDAAVIPAVLGSEGQVLDVGRQSRTFPTSIRRAIMLRDRGCAWPGCDRPVSWCDVHHVAHWARGGETSVDNGCLLCTFHHTAIHASTEWTIDLERGQRPRFVAPAWMDPTRTPRVNTLHHALPPLRT